MQHRARGAGIGMWRQLLTCLAVIAAGATVNGCGGGSGGGGSNGAASTGVVTVSVADAFGTPVAGAVVTLSLGKIDGTRSADAEGRATFYNVRAGQVLAYADALRGDETWRGNSDEVTLAAGSQVDLAVTVRPEVMFSVLGVGGSRLDDWPPDAAGRSLWFSLHLLYLPDWGGDADWQFEFTLADCVPDAANDGPAFVADCVEGAAGFDAAYQVDDGGQPWNIDTPAAGARVPYAAALLVDQSHNMVANDPWNGRLFDLKYFLTTKGVSDRVALAAYAATNAAAGLTSALPQQPVTIFPVANPQFTTSTDGLFETIDSFASLTGGAAPLYAALDAVLDFTAASTVANSRRAVVVLSDGQDDTCGTALQCAAAQAAVIAKSRAAGVPIVTVGVSSRGNGRALSRLTAGSDGISFWAPDAAHFHLVAAELSNVLGGAAIFHDVHFRISSATDGTFQAGRTVLGTLHARNCPWDCVEFDVPIVIAIP